MTKSPSNLNPFAKLLLASIVQLFVVWSIQNLIASAKENNDCHMRELDLCNIGFTSILQNPNGLPMKEVEFQRQCEYLNESLRCIDAYTEKCSTDIQSSLVNLFGSDIGIMVRDFCSAGSEFRANYSKNVECLRDIQRKHQKACVNDLQVGFEYIHKMNTSMRLITVCCNVNRLKECVLPKIEESCGEDAVAFVDSILWRAFGSPLNLLCRNYDPLAEPCATILPATGRKPHNGRNVSAISRLISSFSNAQA